MKYKQKVMSDEELRKMQLIQVELLSDFDRVCRKNNIRYILDAGTLLGAIRYGKFIPWDDDIDVRMLRSDFEKLCKIGNKDFAKNNFFQTYKTDKNYPWLYAKLRRKGTKAVRVGQENLNMQCGVFIDIFPCDGVPENAVLLGFRKISGVVCRKILYARIAVHNAESCLQKFLWGLLNAVPKGVSHGIASGIAKLFDERKSKLVGCLGYHAFKDNNGFKKEWFTDLTEVEFEGKKFLVPEDWDGFLKYSFGDNYMMPPPVENRTTSSPLSSYYLGK